MMLQIGFEILLDGVLLFLSNFAIFNERNRLKFRDGLLALCFVLFCSASRISVLEGRDDFTFTIGKFRYEIVPADGLILFLFLILIVLVTNSLYFQKNAIYTLFGTLAAFSVFIIVREVFILLFYGLGTDNNWFSLIFRICAVLLLGIALRSPFFNWLNNKLDDGSLILKFLIGNTFVFLCVIIVFLDFDITKTADNISIISGTIATLFIIDLFIGIYAQKRSAEIKRINMLEQYVPVIEGLIMQVRAKQHEFNNRLLAISAAVQTANSLEQAQIEIAELTTGLYLDINEKSLLNCDSKITAGMIYSKIKYAEMKKIAVITEITAPIKGKDTREIDIVEIIGILIDNAIEASNAEDIIYIRIEHSNEGLMVSVSNPYAMQSATDFVRMFRRGFTTKDGGTRGHGLANVKEIIERQRGNIITCNETIHERNYVTIGVLLH